MTISVPTPDEPTTLTRAYEGTYGRPGGTKTADQASAIFELRPSEGDCVTRPLTEAAVVQQTVVER